MHIYVVFCRSRHGFRETTPYTRVLFCKALCWSTLSRQFSRNKKDKGVQGYFSGTKISWSEGSQWKKKKFQNLFTLWGANKSSKKWLLKARSESLLTRQTFSCHEKRFTVDCQFVKTRIWSLFSKYATLQYIIARNVELVLWM